jgi:hypothetical protein
VSAHKRNTSGLVKWQKGQSGNPGGRPKLPPELKAFAEYTPQELKRLLAKHGRMSRPENVAFQKRDDASMLELGLAAAFEKCVTYGDVNRLAWLFDRMIGKIGIEAESDDVVIRMAYDPTKPLSKKTDE